MKNSSLLSLNILIGTWNVAMAHVALPETLSWQDSFEWLEETFIIWHWEGKNEVPKATFIIGRNENERDEPYTMLYHDARGVSRILTMSLENGIWKFQRKGLDFSQRFEGRIIENGNTITGTGEMSHDGGNTWEHDYSITYKRIQ